MTTTQTQLRRDTATNIQAATPAAGEPFYDSTNKRLGVGDGVNAGGIPHASFSDIQKQAFGYSTVGGTANAITLTNSPAVASYSGGCLKLQFKATGTNTGSVTVNVDGLGNKNVYKLLNGSLTALSADDIVSGAIYEIAYDGTQFQIKGLAVATPDTLPAAVTGSLSGGRTDFIVDFTTYSAYHLILDNVSAQHVVDLSINAGSSYVVVASGVYWTSSANTIGSYIIRQPSTSGNAYVSGVIGTSPTVANALADSWVLSAAVNRVSVRSNGGSITGSVILQPISKR